MRELGSGRPKTEGAFHNPPMGMQFPSSLAKWEAAPAVMSHRPPASSLGLKVIGWE